MRPEHPHAAPSTFMELQVPSKAVLWAIRLSACCHKGSGLAWEVLFA